MASLADLFNPTFLMFLGILVLVVALLVVYFESKMRDQNHKIASMLSLVSTLAEDLNGVKMGLNHLAMTRVGGGMPPFQQQQHSLAETNIKMNEEDNKLIEVSDDEDEDGEVEEELDDDSELNESEYDDSESETDNESDNNDNESDNNDNVKVLKLNIDKEEIHDIDESDNLEETVSLGDFEIEDELPEVSEEYAEEILNLNYDKNVENAEILTITHEEEVNFPSSSDLKTINITLEESSPDTIDYKKLPLPKLRTIVSEKGLAADASKLKKNELLKLLGAE